MNGSAPNRFGMITAVTLVACWSVRSPEPAGPMVIQNQQQAAKPSGLEGAYLCSISIPEDGTNRYEYPKFHCTITREDAGRMVLRKHGGSQRLEGEIVAMSDRSGFTFEGRFFCPFGSCDQPLHGQFKTEPNGELLGTFTDDTLQVRMVRAPDNMFGGGSYGGRGYGGSQYGYGGYGYGGYGYGGAGYGGRRYRPVRPRRR